MRKSYGTTYWGKAFLNALNNIDYSNRLPRGKTYANKGTVSKIKIEGNLISADVKGSRPSPYRVNFKFPAFSPKNKAQVLELITENPAFLSKLLNRELPQSLEEACSKKGIQLFPNDWRDLKGNCSCPDWAVPCKHMAATLYIVANEIDKNPFLVFTLHDFDLFQGLAGIGYTAQGERDIHIPKFQNIVEDYSLNTEEFTWNEALFQSLDFSKLQSCREQLLLLLGDQPVFYPQGDFKKLLDKHYSAASKKIQKQIKKEEAFESLPEHAERLEDIEVLLDAEMSFLNASFRDIEGKLLRTFSGLEEFTDYLQSVPLKHFAGIGTALRALVLTQRLARKLCEKSALIPQLLRIGVKHYKVRWLPALMNEEVRKLTEKVSQLVPKDLLFYRAGKEVMQPTAADNFSALLSLFLTHYFLHDTKNDLKVQATEAGRLFFNGSVEHFGTFEDKEYPKAIQLWLNRFFISEKKYVPVLQVEDVEGDFAVSVAINDKTKELSTPVPIHEVFAENEYAYLRMEILRSLSMLSDYFPEINTILARKGEYIPVFDSEEFTRVLFKILPVMRLFGIEILLPKALRKVMRPQMSLSMDAEDDGSVTSSSLISLEGMLRFEWQIAVGDKQVSQQEFKQMLTKYRGIVKINDQYVFFEEEEIKKLLNKLENPPEPKYNELLQIALTEDYEGARVALSERLRSLLKDLLDGQSTPAPEGLLATLRPYQQRGYSWLYKNTRLGFGSIIADDMGLGKTLQIITTLLKLKEDGELDKRKALVVVPTTLLTNWVKEIVKFAPALSPHVYHGPGRDLRPLAEADLLLTTYGVARTEAAKLQKQKWLCLIIDEAQAIKNPASGQSKAIKKIKAPVKIAMSGTPVENRLSEYWSIMDFANKGYLDSLKNFKENFAKPIEVERDQAQLDRFKKITEPFILRRLKSDKSIIKDLPDKIEKDQFCTLTKDQAALYQNVVDNTMEEINKSEGIARRGMILKLITALKQICNHPAQFLKKGAVEPAFSGKAMLLMDLLEDILTQNQKTLIFTQYQTMGNFLGEMIQSNFGFTPDFLHGGVARKDRDRMVENFQNNRAAKVLILSLKAGGTGLNLTAANNVIHYDLWWNPAVEAQATDRAYRIGQKSNVLVHRFITQGTFEEKINALLQSKKELADLTVGTGEKWIGEFSDKELRDLVRLG